MLMGADVTQTVLASNCWKMCVRSHECVWHGYEHAHDQKVLTVFSASNYCGTVRNKGAYVVFAESGEYQCMQYVAWPKSQIQFPFPSAEVDDGDAGSLCPSRSSTPDPDSTAASSAAVKSETASAAAVSAACSPAVMHTTPAQVLHGLIRDAFPVGFSGV
jgi:hypothetical protein